MQRRTRLILRRATRRAFLYLLLPALILLTTRLIWGYEASHRLAATRARLIAQGIRLEPPTQPPIPDDQNAALAVIEATKAIDVTQEEWSMIGKSWRSGEFVVNLWTDEQKSKIHQILDRNSSSFQSMLVASKRTSAHWPISAIGLSTLAGQHPLYHIKNLGALISIAALFAHDGHHEREALDDLRLILILSRIVDEDPSEQSHLVAVALRSVTSLYVEQLEPTLRLAETDESLTAANDLLKLLFDESAFREAHARAWEAQIGVLEKSYIKSCPALDEWWIRPLLLDEITRQMVEEATIDVPSVRMDNWQAANAAIPHGSRFSDSNLNNIVCFDGSSSGDSWMYTKWHYRAISDSAAAVLLLSSRIYESQFSRLPTQAVDLVPLILSHVPIDPFSIDHRTMRFRLDPEGPIVWSVGENGTDEDGPVLFDSDGNVLQRYGGNSDPKLNPPDIVYGAAWRTAVSRGAAPSTVP